MMRCERCKGLGQYLGNGMIVIDCPQCYGTGTNNTDNVTIVDYDKRSKHYRDAIKAIMAENSQLSRQQAIALFDKAYTKTK